MDDSDALDWKDGQPRSRRFGDVYFSREGGLDETAHVFLEGNRLAARFAVMPPGGRFAIGETGFGTGLNFLCASQLFDALAPAGAQLDFVSTELYPLSPEDLAQALSLWPQLAQWRARLQPRYGALAPGWHRLDVLPARVRLTLLVGDARQTLPALRGTIHAWFLDGFSPARNPQLWEPSLLETVGRLSAPGATVATYSSAGAVRRALEGAGFAMRKASGFGSKREMLVGEQRGAADAPTSAAKPASAMGRRAAVVGAGLAGCASAASLARRGWQVDLLDRHATVAAESSGNAQGMLYARLGAHDAPLGRLVGSGYQHTLRMLRTLMPCDGRAWSDAPLLQLAFDEKEAARQQALAQLGWPEALLRRVGRDAAQAMAGIALPAGGLAFAQGGWVHPPALCAALVATPGVRLRLGTCVQTVVRCGGGWALHADGEDDAFDVIVLANAAEVRALEVARHLPLRINRGQITQVPARADAVALRAVVCGERYVAPAREGLLTTGATFERSADATFRVEDNARNLEALRALVPALADALGADRLDPARLAGRAGLRCVSPDYLPLAGPLTDAQGVRQPGLYVSLAHGSRGLITAPLCGELVADLIDGTPALLPENLVCALDPGRFVRAPR